MATLSSYFMMDSQVFNGDNVEASQEVNPNVFGNTVTGSIRMGLYLNGDTVDEGLEGMIDC